MILGGDSRIRGDEEEPLHPLDILRLSRSRHFEQFQKDVVGIPDWPTAHAAATVAECDVMGALGRLNTTDGNDPGNREMIWIYDEYSIVLAFVYDSITGSLTNVSEKLQ
jgi:hypothetical protein